MKTTGFKKSHETAPLLGVPGGVGGGQASGHEGEDNGECRVGILQGNSL